MSGLLLVWIGLMGLAAVAGVYVLLRLFPAAFSDSGPAVAWPWQRSSSRPARVKGWVLAAAALASVGTAISGIIALLS